MPSLPSATCGDRASPQKLPAVLRLARSPPAAPTKGSYRVEYSGTFRHSINLFLCGFCAHSPPLYNCLFERGLCPCCGSFTITVAVTPPFSPQATVTLRNIITVSVCVVTLLGHIVYHCRRHCALCAARGLRDHTITVHLCALQSRVGLQKTSVCTPSCSSTSASTLGTL